MGKIRWVIESLQGEFECEYWEKVCCPRYGCQNVNDRQQLAFFVIFQTKDGEWHFLEEADISMIREG